MTEEEALRTGALIDLAWRVSRVPGFRTRMDVREASPFLVIENPEAWRPGRRVTVRTAYAYSGWLALGPPALRPKRLTCRSFPS